jgi:hypothetical protein
MDKRKISISGFLLATLNLTLIVVIAGCQPANMSSNTNSSGNTNAPAANSNSTSTATTTNSDNENGGVHVNAREPERYSANLQFSIETDGGDKASGIPTLSIQVARNGDDRRVEFKLPDGSPLIYLDHNNHHYVIAPAKKQYAELSPEATGFQLHKLLTPGQLVADLKDLKGVEQAGEGLLNGRTAEKYRYKASTNTNTKAGEVKAEAFVYVDKETGLPLRTELNAESSGDVKGVKAARVVAEMRDINTEIAPALFDLPAGYAAVPPEKVRQQIDALTNTVAAILKALMSASDSQPGNSPTPVTSPSPNQ